MSMAFRSRDGSFSPAAMELAKLDEGFGEIAVTPAEAVAWAKDNRVELIAGEGAKAQMARINVMRREFSLPLFVLRVARTVEVPPHLRPKPAAAAPVRPTILPAALAACIKPAAPQEPKAMLDHPHPDPPVVPVATPIATTQEQLLDLVTGFDGTRTGLVTPEVARWLLDLNQSNRPLQGSLVRRFIALLNDGGWVNTGEPVIVSREGLLNDGQHRLHAIAESDIAAPLDVRFGIDRVAYAATNTGTRRTAGQALAISGAKHASAQAAVARLLRHYDAGEMGKANQQVEPAELIRIVVANPHILTVVSRQQACRFAPARIAPIGMVLVVAARKAPMEQAGEFLRVLNTGLAEETNAARALHLRLRDASIARERISQLDAAILGARAWNAWRQGRPLTLIRIDEVNRTSAGFPEIVA